MATKYRGILIFFLIAIMALFFYEWWLFHKGALSYVLTYMPFWVPKKLLVYSLFSLVMLTLCLIRSLPYNIFRMAILFLILLSFYSFYRCGKPIKKNIEIGNKTYGDFFHNKRNIDRTVILNPVDPFRVSFSSSIAMRYGTPVLGGMFFEPLRRYAKFVNLLNKNFYNFKGEQANDPIFSHLLETTDFINGDNIHLINMVNVKYLVVKGFIPKITIFGKNSANPFNMVVDKDIKIYENKDALERAYIVYNAKIINDEERILEELKNPHFNYRNCVILEEEKWEGTDFKKTQSKDGTIYSSEQVLPNDGYAKIIEYKTESVTVEANMHRDGFLVLSEAYYPGWNVFIDGIQGHIYRANYLFRAVLLTKGIHTVQFVYKPFSLLIGAVITIISLIILVSMCMFGFLVHFIKKKEPVT